MGIFGGLSAGRRARGQGRTGEKVQGIRSTNDRYKIDREVLKDSTGNGEASELICMIHGHELRRSRLLVGGGVQG